MGEYEDIFYYITLYNENYAMPAKPNGCETGVLKGMYKFKSVDVSAPAVDVRPQLLGSGVIMLQALAAQQILAEQFNIQPMYGV